jgi:hypothetical protein
VILPSALSVPVVQFLPVRFRNRRGVFKLEDSCFFSIEGETVDYYTQKERLMDMLELKKVE